MLSPLRILVVDDNPDAVATMETMLRLQGTQTRIARDGVEAVEQAELFSPNVILLDIGMPRMNGFEAAKAIRSKPWGKMVKIIAITGWGQAADKQRSVDAGIDHHLTKPVDQAKLFHLLSS